MSGYKDQELSKRLDNSASAKKALLEKFRAQPKPDDPAVVDRNAASQLYIAAREARAAERQAAREAEAARLAAEHAASEAEAARLAAEQAAREAAQKAEE